MKINEVTKQKLEPSKPRNFVAKNMTTGGAGAHRDKKKEQKQGHEKHKGKQYDLAEDDAMKIKAVNGSNVTLDQNGEEINTTADALVPGQQPGTFSMKPADPTALKPGALVTQDEPTSEELDGDVFPIAPDDGINNETDPDLIGSGHNIDVGGDATDRYIDQVRDKGFERSQRGGREGLAGRSKHLGENDELAKMLTIAGLK
jgi:hypothetical protein